MPNSQSEPKPVGEMTDEGWTKRIWIPQLDAYKVDGDQLKHELSIEDRAADDGSKGLPLRTDKTLNDPQMRVCMRIFEGVLLLNQFLSSELAKAVEIARSRIARPTDPERLINRISNTVDDVIGDHHADLVKLRVENLRHQQALNKFMYDNKLTQPARYKAAVEQTLGILAAIFVVESILNGSLLAGISQGGLVGGAMLAAGISAINIGSGLVAGFVGWRYMGHCKPHLKALGAAVMVLLHVVALSWNLFVAHFREAAQMLTEQETFDFTSGAVTRATVEHFQAHGLFGIGSVEAWVLFLLGVFIHFIAAKEGYNDIADRYPEYKHYDKTWRKADEAYTEALADLRTQSRQAVEAIETELTQTAEDANEHAGAVAALLDLARDRRQEVRDSEDSWVAEGTRLLKAYRDVNLRIRGDDPAPAYFGAYPTAQDYRDRSFGGGSQRSGDVNRQDEAVEATLRELELLLGKAQTAAVEADKVANEIHRHITACIKQLDSRLVTEADSITAEGRRRLREQEGGQPDQPPVGGEAHAPA